MCAFVLSQLSLRYGFGKTSEYVRTAKKAVKLTNEDFQSTVFNKSRYVFVYFFSSSCSDCEDYSDDMDDLADHMRARYNIIIASADIDKVKDTYIGYLNCLGSNRIKNLYILCSVL